MAGIGTRATSNAPRVVREVSVYTRFRVCLKEVSSMLGLPPWLLGLGEAGGPLHSHPLHSLCPSTGDGPANYRGPGGIA